MLKLSSESSLDFEDHVQLSELPTHSSNNENPANRSSTTITSKKGFLILALSIVGVFAIAGVAIGVSTSSAPPTPLEEKSSLHSVRNQMLNQVENFTENKKSNREDIKVCETQKCKTSAESLLADMDLTVDPCEDFYQFACGGYYKKHPADKISQGKFNEAYDLVHERIKSILESKANPEDPAPLHDIRTHYSSCLDTDLMDKLGLDPLINQIEVQGGWPMVMDTWDQELFNFEDALAHIKKIKANPFVKIGIESDFLNTTRKMLYFLEGDLGINALFLKNSQIFATAINSYVKYITDAAKLIRDSLKSKVSDEQIMKEAKEMVDFESSLAKIMDLKNKTKTDIYGKEDIKGLQAITDEKNTGQINWLSYFQAVFKDTTVDITENEPVYIYGKSYLTELSTLFSKTPQRTIANYLGWFWVNKMGPESTYDMRNVSLEFEGKLDGLEFQKYREQHCLHQTQYQLDFPVSRAYVDQYFSSKAKEQTTMLVELIRKSFHTRLDENTWMTSDDLVVAREKLDAIIDYVAYPDWIVNDPVFVSFYQKLKIIPGQQFDNLMRLHDFYNTRKLAMLRISEGKVFSMPPTEINAFYDVFSNLISILAGILQPPFYMYDTLAALNIGAIGMVVGHELTHGFDNNGRHFDKDGNLASWWSEETVKAFQDKSKCFVDQYNNFYPPELAETSRNVSVDGQLTLGENIADNGGIREAFTAYKYYVEMFGEEPRLPGLEQYSPEQLFFLGFANVWCEHKTNDALIAQIKTDPHSPGRFRIIGSLSNSEDFANSFNCPVNSPMNRGSDRCILW